ncbi:hypothetical protein [Yersinia kristensenii]|nr:hypothetical protein [Yersinia kristensenii]
MAYRLVSEGFDRTSGHSDGLRRYDPTARFPFIWLYPRYIGKTIPDLWQ